MSHRKGTYLGGVRTVEDLRQRCVMDELTECWHWGLALCDGRPRVWLSDQVPGMDKAARVTGTTAAYVLRHGKRPPKGRKAFMSCLVVDCVNPEHVVPWTRKEHGAQVSKAGIWQNQPHRAMVNRANRRKSAKLSIEKAREIRASAETQTVLAARYGVVQSVIGYIRSGRLWPEAANGSSVFTFRGAA